MAHFFKYCPAVAATLRPASVLPVNVTACTSGCAISAFTSREPTNALAKSPRGNAASENILSIASAQPNTLDACFSTTAFPAMNAGAAARNTCQSGKFHGMIASNVHNG